MMTAKQARRAAALVEALEEFDDVRKGLKKKVEFGKMVLEIGAFEGDESGGSGHGSIFIDLETAPRLLDIIEQFLRDELKALGVHAPRKRKCA